jgi:uncharacterized protein YndB with AHSA1/START domain
MKNNITGKVNATVYAPVVEVWGALTNPDLIKQYFFGTNTTTDWKVGSPIKFTGEWQGKTYEDKGTILAFEPNKLIRYNYWSSMSGIEDKPENYVIVTYEVASNNGGGDNKGSTTITITQENIPDEKMKEHSEENWKKVIDGLKKLVEK